MIKNYPDKFGPPVISHEENPKKKFLENAIKKNGKEQKAPKYGVTVTERQIEHN